MIVITAVDDAGGLMFHHRRQSQDRVLRQKIVEISRHTKLWMSPYTAGQFQILPSDSAVSEDFLQEAGRGEFCFAEDRALLPVRDRIEAVILFHWNRRYPSDLKLDFLPEEQGMRLVKTEEFAGFSHDKITMEVWK